MIEVSTVLFSLLVEGFIVLLVALLVILYLAYKKKTKDRIAIKKLIDQLKQQSRIRMEETGSFLSEKYRFEGNELEKAIKSIDKAEKKFMQKVINVYAKRNSENLISLDAWVAELIETYKGLSPVMPEVDEQQANTSASAESEGEVLRLTELNESLAEELKITKETMGNMISEFGNMFGGGSEHELEQNEVMEKMTESTTEIHSVDVAIPEDEANHPKSGHEVENQVDDSIEESSPVVENSSEDAENDTGTGEIDLGGIDELMDDISVETNELDSSEEPVTVDKKKEEARKEEIKKNNEITDGILDDDIDDLMDSLDLSE